MWGMGPWGPGMWGPWAWIFPLLGLLFMGVMMVACFRMMRGMMGGGGMCGHGGDHLVARRTSAARCVRSAKRSNSSSRLRE